DGRQAPGDGGRRLQRAPADPAEDASEVVALVEGQEAAAVRPLRRQADGEDAQLPGIEVRAVERIERNFLLSAAREAEHGDRAAMTGALQRGTPVTPVVAGRDHRLRPIRTERLHECRELRAV